MPAAEFMSEKEKAFQGMHAHGKETNPIFYRRYPSFFHFVS